MKIKQTVIGRAIAIAIFVAINVYVYTSDDKATVNEEIKVGTVIEDNNDTQMIEVSQTEQTAKKKSRKSDNA